MAYVLQFGPVLDAAPELLRGVALTLQLSGEAIVLGTAVGIVGGAGRAFGARWLSFLLGIYVEIIRNTPLLVQLFILFFGLPLLGYRISANTAALIGITLNLGAYATEIFRAGFLAIPPTQIQAGIALGMSPLQIFRHVIFIPALKIIFPALAGQITLTFLSSSIASAISAVELTTIAGVVDVNTFRSLEVYLVVTLIYIALALCLKLLLALIYLQITGSFRMKFSASAGWRALAGAQEKAANT